MPRPSTTSSGHVRVDAGCSDDAKTEEQAKGSHDLGKGFPNSITEENTEYANEESGRGENTHYSSVFTLESFSDVARLIVAGRWRLS